MSPTGPTPQFGTAEYAAPGNTCKSCKKPIAGNYYRINGMTACERCAQQVQQQMPKDTHAAYVRGITYGIGAAILGFALFAGFVILTGISLGYISLAVGYLIGKGMKLGSGGIGGRRYQIAAAVLTYAAVSMAAIPIAIYYSRKAEGASAAQMQQHPASPHDTQSELVDNPPLGEPIPGSQPKVSLLTQLGTYALLGLASPFLDFRSPVNGIIGLVILAVGINIAWKLTAGPKLEMLGPFQDQSPGALPSTSS